MKPKSIFSRHARLLVTCCLMVALFSGCSVPRIDRIPVDQREMIKAAMESAVNGAFRRVAKNKATERFTIFVDSECLELLGGNELSGVAGFRVCGIEEASRDTEGQLYDRLNKSYGWILRVADFHATKDGLEGEVEVEQTYGNGEKTFYHFEMKKVDGEWTVAEAVGVIVLRLNKAEALGIGA